MKEKPGTPDPLAEETLASRLAYTGQFLKVYEDTVRCPDGHVAPREYLRHPGAVMVVPLLDDGRLVLERQYRYPLRASFIEFPAGKIDPGEDILACAQRELREETGIAAARVQDCRRSHRFPILLPWKRRYAPGIRFNLEHVFRVRLPRRGPVRLNPAEHSAYRWLPRAEAARRASSYTNRDAILQFAGPASAAAGAVSLSAAEPRQDPEHGH
jgi:8-oxo-dGTP pyrophosphatase MutT (NUDIX family)